MANHITINYYSETIDNWGRTESSSKPDQIKKALQAMTDDMFFEGTDENGVEHTFDADDLEGKTVMVGTDLVEAKGDYGDE